MLIRFHSLTVESGDILFYTVNLFLKVQWRVICRWNQYEKEIPKYVCVSDCPFVCPFLCIRLQRSIKTWKHFSVFTFMSHTLTVETYCFTPYPCILKLQRRVIYRWNQYQKEVKKYVCTPVCLLVTTHKNSCSGFIF